MPRTIPKEHALVFKLPVKIGLFFALILVPLAIITWTISVQTIRTKMTEEFTSKGTAIANSLASSSVDLILNRDASTVQALVDQFAAINGVAYVVIYDAQKTLIAHTFAPLVPSGLADKNVVTAETGQTVRDIQYPDPVTGQTREMIDIGVPLLGGQLGTVRVGMNKAIITAAASQAGWSLLAVFGAVAVGAVVAGVIFARRITRPVALMVKVSRSVGQGDLSKLVPVASRDEIGQLAQTFNETIIELRSKVQSEAERDEERRKREELQHNITRFLDIAMEVAQGDLTKRGEVTPDVLGSVVDAINVMMEEIGAILAEVRHAATRVTAHASEMAAVTSQMAGGAEAQARETTTANEAMEAMARSVHQVAASAEASAEAAGKAQEAALKGEQSMRDSLAGMQRIRAETQMISKKIKSLGDRSLEISTIVNTIEEIASHTNLLALNAAIEAAGAGDAGRRFGVVADEIRKLAERAATSTKAIAGLIRAVQQETQEVVVAMEEGTREVEAGYRLTARAEASLQEIASVSRTSSALAQEISLATQQQARGSEGVATAMQSIAKVAVQTEQAVLQARKTVTDLVKLADELSSTLARFKLGAA
jgi:twitching motility protein PilJ